MKKHVIVVVIALLLTVSVMPFQTQTAHALGLFCSYKTTYLAPVASLAPVLVASTPALTGPGTLSYNKTLDASDSVSVTAGAGVSTSALIPALNASFQVQVQRTISSSQSVTLNISYPIAKGKTSRLFVYLQGVKWAFKVQESCLIGGKRVISGAITEKVRYYSTLECRNLNGTWKTCG